MTLCTARARRLARCIATRIAGAAVSESASAGLARKVRDRAGCNQARAWRFDTRVNAARQRGWSLVAASAEEALDTERGDALPRANRFLGDCFARCFASRCEPRHGHSQRLSGVSLDAASPGRRTMSKKVYIFWPGDARDKPNELALPNITEATTQIVKALRRLGITDPMDLRKRACRRCGSWPVSNYSMLKRSLPSAYLDSLGLPCLAVMHRTCLSRTAMYGSISTEV